MLELNHAQKDQIPPSQTGKSSLTEGCRVLLEALTCVVFFVYN